MERKEQLTRVFARSIRDILERAQVDFEQVQEIRLRVRGPLLMVSGGREYYLTGDGRLSGEMEQAHVVSREEIRETMEYISSHSLYAFEEEVRQGFLTIQGGHRVGIAGKTILDDGGIRSMKYISFINIRLSHQIRGCADPVMPYLPRFGVRMFLPKEGNRRVKYLGYGPGGSYVDFRHAQQYGCYTQDVGAREPFIHPQENMSHWGT